MAKIKSIVIKDFSGGWIPDYIKTGLASEPSSLGQYTQGSQVNLYRGGYLGDLSSVANFTVIPPNAPAGNIPVSCWYDTRLTSMSSTEQLLMTSMSTAGGSMTLSKMPIFGGGTVLGNPYNRSGNLWRTIDTGSSGGAIIVFGISGDQGTAAGMYTLDALDTFTLNTTPSGFALPTTNWETGPKMGMVGKGNVSFFTNGQYIGRYDPNGSGSVNNRYQLLAPNYTARMICNYGNFIAIIANDNYNIASGSSKLFIWDGVTQGSFTGIYDLDDSYALTVSEEDGYLVILTQGKSGTFKIRKFNGVTVLDTPDAEIGMSFIEPLTTGLSAQILDTNRIWYARGQYYILGYDGKLWSWGSPYKQSYRYGLHQVFDAGLTSPIVGGSNPYPVGFVTGSSKNNKIFVGYRSGPTSGSPNIAHVAVLDMDNLNPLGAGPDSYGLDGTTSLTTQLYELPPKSNIQRVVVEFSEFKNVESAFDLQLFSEYDNTNLFGFSPLTFSTSGKTYYYPINKVVPDIGSFYMTIYMSCCSVRKITVFYSYDELTA